MIYTDGNVTYKTPYPLLIAKYSSQTDGVSYSFEPVDSHYYKLLICRGVEHIEYFVCYFGGELFYVTISNYGNNPCSSLSVSGDTLTINVQDWGYITTTITQIF